MKEEHPLAGGVARAGVHLPGPSGGGAKEACSRPGLGHPLQPGVRPPVDDEHLDLGIHVDLAEEPLGSFGIGQDRDYDAQPGHFSYN
jgi:hypothetical protein